MRVILYQMLWMLLICGACVTAEKQKFQGETQSTNAGSNAAPPSDASFVLLPKPTGPFFVSTKPIHVEDTLRTMPGTSSKRHWMIQAFFPSNAPKNSSYFRQRGTYPYAAILRAAGSLKGHFVEGFASPYGSINYDWTGDFPVIILAASLSFGRFDYTILCEELASYGFVVLVMEIPNVTSFVKLNDMSVITPKINDLWNFKNNNQFKNKFLKQTLKDYALDIQWIINNLPGIENFLNCQFDKTRILMMGHAEGVEVSKKIALTDSSIAGFIEYYPQRSPYFPVFKPTSPISKPILTFIAHDGLPQNHTAGFFDFIQFHFHQPQSHDPSDQNYVTQMIINTAGKKDALTDYAYLLNEISAIKERKPFAQFLSWFFKIDPLIENQYLEIVNENPQKWFLKTREQFIQWMKKHNFII